MSNVMTYQGSLSIGSLCPLSVSAQAAAFADLNARVTGLLALQAELTITPPSLSLNITLVGQLLAQLEAALMLGVTFPSISLQLTAVAALIASLEANLALLLSLQITFGAAGVFVYTYEGTVGGFGPAASAATSGGLPDGTGPTNPMNALVLATVTPATLTAMRAFFGGAGL